MPTCPHCNCEIDEEVEMLDWEYYGSDIIRYYSGECPKCHHLYKWEETYKWTETFDNLEEM